ncbi:DUF397 domain-containing protein [Streptomyces sp. NPDC047017]|uniref:DUF397 domain-containing protein n=1 Tax=Streptomyces sp. NPDC047017 TaxID=3155024 RepID=UPI0033F23EEA
MTDASRADKLATLNSLLEHDRTGLTWTKSARSSAGANDCVEVVRVSEKGGWLVRNSNMPDKVLAFTDSEYAAFIGGVTDGQTGLVPGV